MTLGIRCQRPSKQRSVFGENDFLPRRLKNERLHRLEKRLLMDIIPIIPHQLG